MSKSSGVQGKTMPQLARSTPTAKRKELPDLSDRCRKCGSYGYCYFQDSCGRERKA